MGSRARDQPLNRRSRTPDSFQGNARTGFPATRSTEEGYMSRVTMFKQAPDEFLRMIVVHELAHLREKGHDKAFYQLCAHMEPQYHQYEFDLRLYLTHVESTGTRLWGAESA
eukprot:gene33554-41405_t